MSKILLASDEVGTSEILTKLLKTEGYKVVSTAVLSQAQESVETDEYDLLIASTAKAFDPSLSLLESAKSFKPEMPVIVIKDDDDEEATKAIDAYEPYAAVVKPLKVDRLLVTVQKAIDFSDSALTENVNLNLQLEKVYQFEGIIAESPAMKSVCDMVSRVAGIDVTILLEGESGTGKHEIARTIHTSSSRKDNPFISVDCATGDPETELFGAGADQGALELANGGTVLIREISRLSPSVQDKLHMCLVEKSLHPAERGDIPFDVRIIASTSEDLDKLSKGGKFKQELYKTLKVIFIKVQPLRNRTQDIMPTFRRMLQAKVGDSGALPGVDPEVVEILEKSPWPGNVDDIEKVIEHSLKNLVDNTIKKQSLPADIL